MRALISITLALGLMIASTMADHSVWEFETALTSEDHLVGELAGFQVDAFVCRSLTESCEVFISVISKKGSDWLTSQAKQNFVVELTWVELDTEASGSTSMEEQLQAVYEGVVTSKGSSWSGQLESN